MDIIRENPPNERSALPWDWYGISENINLTMEMIKNNPDKHWD